MANTMWTPERGSMQGNEGKRGSLRERRQMEESDSFNSLKVSSERQRQKGREGEESNKKERNKKKARKKERKTERKQVCRVCSPSVQLTVLGLKGAWISSLSRRSQSIQRKNGCSLISLSASAPPPRRLAGCFVRSWARGKKKRGKVEKKNIMIIMGYRLMISAFVEVVNNVHGKLCCIFKYYSTLFQM